MVHVYIWRFCNIVRLTQWQRNFNRNRASISKELEDKLLSLYALGMSTRDVSAFVREHYGLETSEMFVSRLTAKLDEELTLWRNRPLESIYAVLLIDAFFLEITICKYSSVIIGAERDSVKPKSPL